MSISPFNEVDGLIAAKLTSLDFTGIVPSEGGAALRDAVDAYFERYGDKDVRLGVLLPPGTVTMVKKMLASKRFAGVMLYDYVNHIDDVGAEQFCALTVSMPDGSHFVAFRGTDDTIAAWREDFNMSAHDAVPAQVDAASYLKRAGWRFDGVLRVGGHSKGGNLSVYAAMSASAELQERIADVFNYDGPGFRESVRGEPDMSAYGRRFAPSCRSTLWWACSWSTIRRMRLSRAARRALQRTTVSPGRCWAPNSFAATNFPSAPACTARPCAAGPQSSTSSSART